MVIDGLQNKVILFGNGIEVSGCIQPTSYARKMLLDKLEKDKTDWKKANPKATIEDIPRKTLAEWYERCANIIIRFDENAPDRKFYEADDFESSRLITAQSFFLTIYQLV